MPTLWKIAGVQMNPRFAEKRRNLERIESGMKEAAGQGARLVVFPECALDGYCYESLAEATPHAEPAPGESTDRLAAICRSLDAFAVVGMLEREGESVYNSCVLVGPQGLLGCYRKIHLPFLGVDRFTTPGDRPFAAWEVGPIRVGMNICYDGSFPESARVMTLLGADLIVLPTNWPPGSECAADCVINSRAMENHIYYMAVNRVGEERGFRFIGRSKICGPGGETLAVAPEDEESILYAEIDPEKARRKRQIRVAGKHEIDRVADRRPEMYAPLVAPVVKKASG